jgi:hypothetical protein
MEKVMTTEFPGDLTLDEVLDRITAAFDSIDPGDYANASPDEAIANLEVLLRIQRRVARLGTLLDRMPNT